VRDTELKNLLLETCPIRPGQEERAWTQLKGHFSPTRPSPSESHSFLFSWRGALAGCFLMAIILTIGDLVTMSSSSTPVASASSQMPGVYATAFYSHSTHAQVVWLNGMEPASDKLTYLDPTTAIPSPSASENSQPSIDPNGL